MDNVLGDAFFAVVQGKKDFVAGVSINKGSATMLPNSDFSCEKLLNAIDKLEETLTLAYAKMKQEQSN